MIFEARLVQNALLAAESQYIGVDTAPTQVRHSCITVCVWLLYRSNQSNYYQSYLRVIITFLDL